MSQTNHRYSTLLDLPCGGRGRVLSVLGDDAASARLRELGFTAGTEVGLMRRGPLGGALMVNLRGYDLCLRPAEARRVAVE